MPPDSVNRDKILTKKKKNKINQKKSRALIIKLINIIWVKENKNVTLMVNWPIKVKISVSIL